MTTVTALVVEPDGYGLRQIVPDLDHLKGLVGGWLEAVNGPDWHVYVNEEGRMLGLPTNPLASALLYELGRPVGPVVGTAVFLGQGGTGEDAGAEEADVPQSVLRVLEAIT